MSKGSHDFLLTCLLTSRTVIAGSGGAVRATTSPAHISKNTKFIHAAIAASCVAILGVMPSLAGETQRPQKKIVKPALAPFVTVVEGLDVSPAASIANANSSTGTDVTTSISPETPVTAKKKKSAKKTSKRKKSREGEVENIAQDPVELPAEPPAVLPVGTPLAVKPAIAIPAIQAVTKPTPSWPKTIEEAKAEADAATRPPDTWSEAEIGDAKARCSAILQRISAVAIPQPPIRQGACGAPAPVQLVSIGSDPQVSISPPATVTCELAEALNTWLAGDLQPLAKKHLGAEIIRIENMSDYSCRNAYGRTSNKLSEHGVANALDIRGFVTATGKTAYLLEHWGTPQREILARIAAEKAAAEKALAAKLAADKAAQDAQRSGDTASAKASKSAANPPITTGTTVGTPAGGGATAKVVDGKPKVTVTLPGGTPAGKTPSAASGLGLTEPSKLGGPKAVVKLQIGAAVAEPTADKRRAFLHQAQEAACRIFGTTLGPEANAAHRNHFHVDMAPRKFKKICE